jgi:hypothetical protein
MIAAELEVDAHKLHTVLDRHVREHLASLAEVRRTCVDRPHQEMRFMLKALRHHQMMIGMVEVLADAVRYVATVLLVVLLLRQLAKFAL